MKSTRQLIVMIAVALTIGIFSAPGRAMASDRWSFGFPHNDDHGGCGKIQPRDHDKDCDKDHDKDSHESKSVPEIDPSGLTGLATILAGGMALITARRRRIM